MSARIEQQGHEWVRRIYDSDLDEWPEGTRTEIAVRVLLSCRKHRFRDPKPDELSALAILAWADGPTVDFSKPPTTDVPFEQWAHENDRDRDLAVRGRRARAWGRALARARRLIATR